MFIFTTLSLELLFTCNLYKHCFLSFTSKDTAFISGSDLYYISICCFTLLLLFLLLFVIVIVYLFSFEFLGCTVLLEVKSNEK